MTITVETRGTNVERGRRMNKRESKIIVELSIEARPVIKWQYASVEGSTL